MLKVNKAVLHERERERDNRISTGREWNTKTIKADEAVGERDLKS